MKSNSELVADIGEELLCDPRISDVNEIAVSADDGRITLRGTVGSLHQKRAAEQGARRVYCVKSVANELEVRLLSESRREDADIRGAALQALMLDSLVPADQLDVNVKDGWLTLTGKVEWEYQRDAAEDDVLPLIGLVDVDDQITVENAPLATDVAEDINEALARNAELQGTDIEVSTSNGTVTLSGVVDRWSQHDEAVDAAWFAPGVSFVDDRIEVVF